MTTIKYEVKDTTAALCLQLKENKKQKQQILR